MARLEPRIVVAKEGYAGYVSEPLLLKEGMTGKVPTRRSHSLGARCLAEWRRRRSSRATGGRGLGPVQQAVDAQIWIISRHPGSPDGRERAIHPS